MHILPRQFFCRGKCCLPRHLLRQLPIAETNSEGCICKTLVPADDGYNDVFNCSNMESNALLDGCNKQSNKLVDPAYTASFSDAFQIADQHSLSSLSTTFNGRSAIN